MTGSYTSSVSSPYETLLELRRERGFNVFEFLSSTGLKGKDIVNDIPITPEMAERLERNGWGIAEFWVKRSNRYHEWKSKYGKVNI